MEKKKPIIAIMYDFDKTLCDQDMQNYSFIPNLGMTPQEFWGEIGEFSKKTNMEGILAYLYYMLKKCNDLGIELTENYLKECGKNVNLYPGVETWFDRINEYAEKHGATVEHYIISSGTKPIIEATSIASKFKEIYACDYLYDENGKAIWPKNTINFTTKTQYIYRINKGIADAVETVEINKKYKADAKRIPFSNMIYIGDGLTDVPCMIMLKKQGGNSIGIYKDKDKVKVQQFLVEDRINYVCRANYNEKSDLERTVKLIIKSICNLNELQDISNQQFVDAKEAIEAQNKQN